MVTVTHPRELAAVAERLRGLVAGIDPSEVTAREAPGLWSGLEDIRRLASGAQITLAGLVDESDAPAKAGLRNGAEWMAQRSGGSLRSGYDAVATAKRLADLPDVAAALRDGRLSVAQASTVADAAAVDPTAAGRLVVLAQRVSLGELRRECLRVKAAADPDPDKTRERIRRERRLRWFVDNEGALNLSGRGPIEAGSEIATVLAPIIEDIFAAAHEAGIQEPRDAYTWDALVQMARMAWAYMHGQTPTDIHDDHDHTADEPAPERTPEPHRNLTPDADPDVTDLVSTGGDGAVDDGQRGHATNATASDNPAERCDHPGTVEDVNPTVNAACLEESNGIDADADSGGEADAGGGSAEPVGQPMRRRRADGVNPWLRAGIRVDYSALVRGWVEGEEVCDIAGVGPIPVRVARELLGDAVLHLLVTKGQDVATVVYLGRGQNTAQKIASAWAQPECQRRGCHRPVMEWDHRRPFAEVRVTETRNIDGLCTPDHKLKTLHGWELVDGVGKRDMVPPSDPRHPAHTRSKARDEPLPEPRPVPASVTGSAEPDELSLFDEPQSGSAEAASRSLLSAVGA